MIAPVIRQKALRLTPAPRHGPVVGLGSSWLYWRWTCACQPTTGGSLQVCRLVGAIRPVVEVLSYRDDRQGD